MSMLRAGLLVLGAHAVALAALEPSFAQIFFESSQSFRQAVPLAEETRVLLECALPEEKVKVQRSDDREVVLQIAGRFSIAGYHGSPKDAGVRDVAAEELAFRVARAEKEITLSSPEWIFIHHALLIDHLQITLPTSAALRYRQIPGDELERRKRRE